MAGPDWLRWTLTILFLAVAAYCVFRLARARHVPGIYLGCHRATDVGHGMMCAGMAVMCSPVGGPIPVAGWQTAFLVSTSWFAASWLRQRHSQAADVGWHGGSLHHAVAGLAMLYMLTAMPSGDGHHGMAAPWMPGMHDADLALPVVGWGFATYFVVHATILGIRAVRATPSCDARVPALLTAPRLTATCQIFMALGMSYMLVA
ncbi:DUF5134 domain-containing protein [Actinophytocola oryzae]|uniref:Uncharacterized protein DUF5134 n=1 Tax=Actinophytocola oryzae TaxID=502181 RepID=A0A4R7VZ74_9PSEU|nr:DUF5134 domain-containing protein [Actinophytocola oryzae]TDV54859.1 uncharacterized protein DUF5134 [Actinophytocola oryzae]